MPAARPGLPAWRKPRRTDISSCSADGTHAYTQTLYQHPPYDALNDFAPVALLRATSCLDRPQGFAGREPAGFIAYAKSHQTKMQYGSAGAGSAAHLACVVLNSAAGVTVTHVPYRGGGQAMQDLIAGRIDYQCPLLPIATQQIQSGSVKAIALLSRERSRTMPSLATAREQGLAEVDVSNWSAFFLPKGTPPAIVQKLHEATVATMDATAVRGKLDEMGVDLVVPERRSAEYLQVSSGARSVSGRADQGVRRECGLTDTSVRQGSVRPPSAMSWHRISVRPNAGLGLERPVMAAQNSHSWCGTNFKLSTLLSRLY